MTRAAAALAWMMVLAAACSNERVDVAPATGADLGRSSVLAALAELRAARHTPAAFRSYADRMLALRPAMDETVADEAELLTVTEAHVVMQRALDAGVTPETLALTVWPIGLAPPIAADTPGQPNADEWTVWVPKPDENAGAYLERLCGGVLALECKDVVPEGHAGVVGGLVVERYTKRARRAIATCLTCSEPGWAAAAAGWEALERGEVAREDALRERFAPSRWPVAGDGAVDIPDGVATVELAGSDRSERVRYALDDARKQGAARVALIAREPAYPYRRRAYLLATGAKLPVRDGEPVQVLARALDGSVRRAKPRR